MILKLLQILQNCSSAMQLKEIPKIVLQVQAQLSNEKIKVCVPQGKKMLLKFACNMDMQSRKLFFDQYICAVEAK